MMSFDRLYRGYFRDESLLDPARLINVRFEDLIADPLGQLKRIYEQLGLEDFSASRRRFGSGWSVIATTRRTRTISRQRCVMRFSNTAAGTTGDLATHPNRLPPDSGATA